LDRRKEFQAIVLDVMLPGVSGFEVASRLRAANNFVPVLMLTARSRPEDVLQGFESGADDYLPKPFELNVLLARLNALLRRREWFQRDRRSSEGAESEPVTEPQPPDVITIGGRTIDFSSLELRTPTQTVHLTLMEADLLRYLFKHQGRVVSRKAMLEDVWGLREDTDTRAIDNFIVRLRKYIEDEPNKPKYLLTVRGVGYRLQVSS
jgi:DNA-binding response OmpR family regulator